jgi:hypothetical protein
MNKLLAILLLLTTAPVLSQERKTLQGKVLVDGAALNGAFVINKQAGTEVKTDGQGGFSIAAKPGDKLVVYSDRSKVREFVLGEASFTAVPYELAVDAQAYQLEEVVVETQTVTTESLGLAPKNQRRKTVAERRLDAAESGPLDLLINTLNGKRRLLKRELATERKTMAIDMLNGILNEDEITAQYHIPDEQIAAFIFYAIEEPQMQAALRAKNDALVKMLLIDQAAKYLQLQKELPQPAGTPAPQGSSPELQTPQPAPANEN